MMLFYICTTETERCALHGIEIQEVQRHHDRQARPRLPASQESNSRPKSLKHTFPPKISVNSCSSKFHSSILRPSRSSRLIPLHLRSDQFRRRPSHDNHKHTAQEQSDKVHQQIWLRVLCGWCGAVTCCSADGVVGGCGVVAVVSDVGGVVHAGCCAAHKAGGVELG